ncbi:Gfo/Idh/MocA family oxidoreductase [Rubellicoccus peritrichatus]|uniref:Gfo/Idh/MocA family oxidoreductase n=1 Tax=Rubellicoccus peritrichatus TaxID=3080537 RepID=A0AAQ3L5S1_9BACT|nr:Gfo/Idh/MocA family oxidoreductase [Puniceicoccus sp. CR14]WOO39396.1 Gfo/Idh/MocA family oxidoreductase [Puniceicoccus sp. CR14]
MKKVSRRNFLKSSAALGSFIVLPSYVALGSKAKSGIKAPSERVNVAFVASGGKGYRNRLIFENSGLMNVVALCDVDLEREEPQKSAAAHPGARQFTDFRVMLEEMEDEIDAVVVSTPDHSHFAVTMMAMALGKHVWCEKPLAHSYGQCQRMMDLAERSGVVTQMGNQGHSSPNYFQFKEWTEAGVIKDITKIDAHMTRGGSWGGWGKHVTKYESEPLPEGLNWENWIDVAEMNPYSPRLHPNKWRGWVEYGNGFLGDWAPHILDTCHRFLKLGMPEKITAIQRVGGNDFVFPEASIIRFDVPAREGMPACEINWYDGWKNKPKIDLQYGDLVTDNVTGKASRKPLELDYAGKMLYSKDMVFKGGHHGQILQVVPREKYIDIRKSLPRFQTRCSDHWTNFLLACKGEEETRSPFSVGAPLTQFMLLGVICQRVGGELEFDRESERFTNSDAANALLDPAPRKGWEEFYAL